VVKKTDGGAESLVKASSATAKEAQANFNSLAEDAALHRRCIVAAHMLDPVIRYSRFLDGEKSKLPLVVPAVDELRHALAQTPTATGEAADAIVTDLSAVAAAAGPR
jgi:hypothetical protein